MNEVQDELKTVVLWISEQTSGMLLPAGLRARMALGCLDLAIEHQAGICALAEQALWGPVFATALGLLSATELASLSGHRDVARACKARTAEFATHAATH